MMRQWGEGGVRSGSGVRVAGGQGEDDSKGAPHGWGIGGGDGHRIV